MTRSLVKKNALENILNHISRMENSKSCLICVACPNNFSFSTWDEFKLHKCASESASYFECIYCSLLVLWKHGESHVNSHFKHSNQSLYNCPNCLFSCNTKCKILKHTITHGESSSNLQFRCHGCEELFDSSEDLIEHVNFNKIVIYNCCVTSCFVKARNKFQMCDHYKRMHPSKTTSFEVNLILACSERTPDVVFTNQLLARISAPARELAMGIFHAASTQRTSGVYLECFNCDFSTCQWHNFIRHYFKCTLKNKKNDSNHTGGDLNVYICSACFTVSTKRGLVEEHLLNCDRNANIITEILPTRSNEECVEIVTKEDSNKPCKRTRSLCSNNQELSDSKRPRITESPESKCQTDEAILSDYDETDLNPEFVSIPFDEDGFVSNNPSIPYHQKETIITKMRQFSQCQINIVGKENYGRIPECPNCHKIFTYGFGDFKRHFISVHLDIDKDYIKECQKYTRLPKGGDKCQEIQEQLSMRNLRPLATEKDKIRVPLPYSIVALRQLIKLLPVSTQQYLLEKMKAYSVMSIIIQNADNSRRFLCHQCSYSSPYALADVRKHIMGSHCGISTKHFRYCLQASRLDPNEFILLSDDKILNLAEELSRRTKQKSLNLLKPSSPSPTPAPLSSPTNGVPKLIISPHNNRYKKWSKTPKKSRSKSETFSSQSAHSHPVVGRKGVNALFLNADSNCKLSLPYSEKVLETLLQSAVDPDQISTIMQKMKVYANYSLTRLCKNERTVAFQCPCGRVFHTARVPDLKMRAATLADARRHVMGVHAKIPQTLITVCCQASRICRENDFQLYSDEMLLQLASERQGKLPDSRSNGQLNDSSSKSQDCQADSCADLGEENSPIPSFFNAKNSFLIADTTEEVQCPIEETSLLSVDEETVPVTNDSETSRLDSEKSKIERIINLPYSLEALKCLTDGYCEPSFFAVLQEKMDIYAKYRIFIIRREGRRIFCCSGCPSSSPHGMGDVKKHILGVHARIPERFKAAAMHCSRLSREDTSLLPDHLLLQLAKMKWKGSVIKPLSEMTIEDRIKNFGKTNSDGNVPKMKFENFYSMVDRGIVPVDETEEEREARDNDDIVEEGFHLLSAGDSEIIVPEDFFVIVDGAQSDLIYKCSMCEYESRFIGNCKGHIVREHLGIPAHTCSVCEQLFNTRTSVVAHHDRDHRDSSLPFTLAHYSPYKIAISRINVKEITTTSPTRLNRLVGDSKSTMKRNSFLQHSQDSDLYLI